MIRLCICIATATLLIGCGGLSITKASPGQSGEGYPVYAPLVLINVSATKVCAQPLVDGKCVGEKYETKCSVGAPYYVPNYKDKYFVEFNSGVGSYSGAVTINNGWMLGGATSTGSATPFVTDLLDAAMTDNSGKPSGCTEGVYVLNSDNQFVEFDGSPFRSSAE